MVKRSIYILLVAAITLNIGAGIWYNGVPVFLSGVLRSADEIDIGTQVMSIPRSRSGDIYVTSYNMSVDYSSVGSGGDQETGYYSQEGTMTRSIGNDIMISDMQGSFEMSFNRTGTPPLSISGDMERTRTIFKDFMSGRWEEDIETSLLASLSHTSARESSRLKVHLNSPKRSWGDTILSDLKDNCGQLNSTSKGSLETSLSIDEISVFVPDVEMDWQVGFIEDQGSCCVCRIDIVSENVQGVIIECSLLFQDDAPHPLETKLSFRIAQVNPSSSTSLELTIMEELLDLSMGDGKVIDEILPSGSVNKRKSSVEVSSGMLPESGTGDSAFWSSPAEVFELGMAESEQLRKYLDEEGSGSIGYRRISYHRNDSFSTSVKDWNITLGSERAHASGSGYYLQVAVSPTIGRIPRNWMEVSAEGSIPGISSTPLSEGVITLDEFENSLRSSVYEDKMFVGTEHSSNFGMEIIRRGPEGQYGVIPFINSIIGIEKASESNIFIGHVQDRSDPLKLYVVVVDGSTGEIISNAESEGLSTLMINRYGLDPA